MYRGTTDATIENFGYVYKTTNKVNNKIYVGKHKSNRFDENYLGSGVLLSSAIKKYGKENFITEVLEWCDNDSLLNDAEIYWIARLNSQDKSIGYNIAFGGNGGLSGEVHPLYGKHHTKESREKMSKSHLGNTNRLGTHCSKQTIDKLRVYGKQLIGDKNPFYGKHHTNESKIKISNAKRGKSSWNKGISPSIDTRTKISNSLLGEKNVNSKKVVCITTGEVFSSYSEAAKKYHTYPNHIGQCCRKELTFCGKLPDGTKLLWENYEV